MAESEDLMAKYQLNVAYTLEGIRGVQKEGGSKRRDVARALIESLGGKMEAFYFAFGKNDVVILADFPDATSGATVRTTVLLTPEDVDAATKKQGTYTRPGG
jgi:uncharacterized protein with GYD domain